MDRQPWLERVNAELAGQGLPVGVRLRLLEELRDHMDDLTEGGTNVITGRELSLRMGAPEDVAEQAAVEHRQASWVRRHPRRVFLLMPIPSVLLSIVLYTLAAGAVGYVLSEIGVDRSTVARPTLERVASAFVFSIGFVPFLLMAALFSRLAVRAQVRSWWLLAAVAQIGLLAGLATTSLTWSDVPGESQFMLGFGFPFSGWRQSVQLLLPLTVGLLALWAASRSRNAEVAV